jgi:hypothetical protein
MGALVMNHATNVGSLLPFPRTTVRKTAQSVFTRVHSYSPTPPAPPVGLGGLTWAVPLRISKIKRALSPPGAVQMTGFADDSGVYQFADREAVRYSHSPIASLVLEMGIA